MNNSPINSTINSTMVVELADARSLSYENYKVPGLLNFLGIRHLENERCL